ncbi:Glutamate-gated chloride channel [Eufriesea mexicana]|uniref:Glutamate-gated chloride channel n=1 Tax=Eufriesea mexicana TaxID=516756 RepID=A0A310SEJ8_9HYME|nr:Glutamate-gated chloride channel [Eufriesea mexicana]
MKAFVEIALLEILRDCPRSGDMTASCGGSAGVSVSVVLDTLSLVNFRRSILPSIDPFARRYRSAFYIRARSYEKRSAEGPLVRGIGETGDSELDSTPHTLSRLRFNRRNREKRQRRNFEEGKSDKEILDNLLLSTRYDKRLLPPVQGTLRPPPHTRQDDYTPDYLVPNDPDHPEHLEHHRHRYHHTAPHNHSSLLTPRQKDADFCCGMRWPGDATGLSNRSSTSSNDPKNQYKNQNNNHYTSHQHLRTHLRGTLTVNVSVLLLSLASPDESSLKYEVEFLLQQQWYDPRLRYSNRSQYEFLNAIHHYNDIWLPDTYFIMHGDFKDPLIPVHFALRIYRNGTVNYLMRRHLILSCQGRLNIFPFDDPLCSFAIESISYEQTAITYVWKNDEGTLRKSPSLTSLNAYLIKNQTITCPIKVILKVPRLRTTYFETTYRTTCTRVTRKNLAAASLRSLEDRLKIIARSVKDVQSKKRGRKIVGCSVAADGQIMVDYEDEFDEFGDSKCSLCQRRFEEQGNYSCLKVDLIFTRDRAFYFTTVFIPGIILVTSSFITFWLEWNAVPARVMIGVTTMLNFFTTSNGFRSTLPVVSNLTAMNVWDGVCMCFIYASLLEFVCVNYVGRKRPMHNVVYRPGENPVTQTLSQGKKKREGGPPTGATTGPNEIVTCTNCGPNPCTHTATNGCTAELRKKEPPHPIRVAKTIDVIARITFPVAYFMFLTFFFIHYKGTS